MRKYPSYNLYRDSRQEWRWTYEARNGKTIAVSSEGYKQFADARHAVALMQSSSGDLVYVPADLVSA